MKKPYGMTPPPPFKATLSRLDAPQTFLIEIVNHIQFTIVGAFAPRGAKEVVG